jgi:hypothetical protein
MVGLILLPAAHLAGLARAVLKSPRHCTVLAVVDERRRIDRHHGMQRDAPRRIRHATLHVAPHRYATLEPPSVLRQLPVWARAMLPAVLSEVGIDKESDTNANNC